MHNAAITSKSTSLANSSYERGRARFYREYSPTVRPTQRSAVADVRPDMVVHVAAILLMAHGPEVETRHWRAGAAVNEAPGEALRNSNQFRGSESAAGSAAVRAVRLAKRSTSALRRVALVRLRQTRLSVIAMSGRKQARCFRGWISRC